MSGLSTAIILIAFVTVASVLAYSVLSAGLFSAEKAKETVNKGLERARGTLELSTSVIGCSPNETRLESIVFFVRLAIPNQRVDINSITVNYLDKDTHYEGCIKTIERSSNTPERGHAVYIEQDEQYRMEVTIPESANVGPYDSFTVQVLSTASQSISITRKMPPVMKQVIDLQ